MRLPGRVGIILLSSPADAGSEAKAAAAFRPLAARFRAEGFTYLQSLVENDETPRRRVLEQAGFRHVTTLEYLSRASVYPWVDPPPEGLAEWIEFRDEIRPRFESVVLATYEDTLDCPELCGRRAVADVLAAHRASGEFRPQWWQIASRDGRDVGCMLLAGVIGRSALEVAYMGVTPSARGTGVGGLLLRQALHQARVAERAEVTLVVDARNAPARRLYERFGFRAIAFREAYLQFLTDEHA
ncbi:MAG: GNAT family N-acetyltransferase [Planctomycetes bacterium]|nr:GNAT family N-acetyltransferase [Planctomycetota bacterium]